MRGRKAAPVRTGGTSQAPTPPRELSASARDEWDRVVPLLEAGGVVQQVDRAILIAYCTTFAQWWESAKRLATEDVVLDGKLNPRARYCSEQLKQLRGLLDQLGFTPAARKQVLQGLTVDPLEEVLS